MLNNTIIIKQLLFVCLSLQLSLLLLITFYVACLFFSTTELNAQAIIITRIYMFSVFLTPLNKFLFAFILLTQFNQLLLFKNHFFIWQHGHWTWCFDIFVIIITNLVQFLLKCTVVLNKHLAAHD